MSLIPDFQRNILTKIINASLKGSGTVKVERKSEITSTSGPEADYGWVEIYEELDCLLLPMSSLATTGAGLIPTGIIDLTKSICYVPSQIVKNGQFVEIIIKNDDRLTVAGEKYKVLRPIKYSSHQELICEPVNE